MEFIYVVKRYDLFDLPFPHSFIRYDFLDLPFPHGFISGEDGHFPNEQLLGRIRTKGFFIERRQAENDSSFKQIVPYCVIECSNRIFLVRRFAKQGEKRLHNLRSIGVGGHINPIDDVEDILDAGCERELAEEISISCPYSKGVVGFINDESNPVGSVHFGVVYLVTVEMPAVEVREKDMMEGRFADIEEIRRLNSTERATFETWSQLIIDGFPRLRGD